MQLQLKIHQPKNGETTTEISDQLNQKKILKNLLSNLINWKFDDQIGIFNVKLEKKLVQTY